MKKDVIINQSFNNLYWIEKSVGFKENLNDNKKIVSISEFITKNSNQ